MGRGRLRRGCSLEVIFEEDPDFCSHLDSLDGGVAIRFGIKEPDETISLDSLLEVEEYQVRFQDPADAEQVFRSLDGFIDVRNMDNCMVEWDEFSMDSNSGKIVEEAEAVTVERDPFLDSNDFAGASNAEKVASGRRSRVSRRQIIQATWLGYSSSSDESVTNNDPDDTDKTNGSSSATTARQQRRRSPSNRLSKTKLGKDAGLKSDESIEPTSSASAVKSDSSSGSGSSPNLVTSVEDFAQTEGKEGANGGLLKPRIQLHLRSSPNNTDSSSHAAPHGIFGRSDAIDIMEKDTLDSYISTMTDETDTNAYTFADPFDDTHSVASTSYESSSGSTSSTESNGSVCTVNSFSMQKGRSKSNGNEGKSSSGVSNGNRTGGTSGGGNSSSSKYRSNLKVELVTQLNKSQEANLHSTITTSASSAATVNPSNLYSGNSHLNLQSSSAAALTPAAAASSNNSSGVLSKYPNNQQLHRQQQQQQPLVSQISPDQDRQSFGGDVKRVRALFELRNHSRTSLDGSESIGSSSNGSTCPSSPESTARSISSRNGGDTSPRSSPGRTGLYSKNGRRSRASPQNQQHPHSSTAGASTKVLRSAYSNLSLNQMSNAVGGSATNLSASSNNAGAGLGTQPSYDYVDLLVNDKVVIEDAPDIYQTNRSRRPGILERDVLSSLSTSNSRPTALMNLSPRDKASGGSLLRRSRSMGTGISALGSPSSACSVETGMITQSSSKTNILAEELPAPDTVKNVRNVFENMLKMRSSNNGSESSVDITPTGFTGSFSIVKKSLSYIKSNPTSRIYRSESMRDDFPSLGRRYGKPVLTSEASSPVHSPSYPSFVASSPAPSSSRGVGSLAETVTSNAAFGGGSISEEVTVTDGCKVSPRNKSSIERKISEPAKFSPKINTGLSPCGVPTMLRASLQAPLTEEDSSFSSNVTTEDYRSRKYVHADVLQKIRSAGTTTTYFGGKIVAKTIKNRKIPLSRRHTFDFQDYVGISGDGGWYSNYDPYNSSNYYRDDETFEKCQNVGSTEISEARSSNSSSSRPALEIPLKSSSSTSIYASRNTTISGALDSIFAGGVGGLLTFASKPIDTTPRIISVLAKSPPGSQTGSPVKSCSPVSSVIEEGRNSPEGCEASNEKAVEQDGNNNNLPGKLDSPSLSNCTGESKSFNKKFSQITEGAWF